jgi:peptidyl-prolyl cis-trans isomerase A (cyclophilin A)
MISLKRRDILALAFGLLALPAAAQTPQPAPPLPPLQQTPPRPRVVLNTIEGQVVIELATDKAPITTANFLRYVDQKRYDGASFYRASQVPGAPELGMVQGGLNSDPARKLPPIAHESTQVTGLTHKEGAVSLARRAQGTATSEFFICVGPQTYLDADPSASGDNGGFAVFGQVVEGMDVVKKILALPTSQTAGSPEMKGEMLLKPVTIKAARRAPAA